ncbi:MAG: sulfatase [Bacillota bacterium]|nr:sulfatase [Bacillota bacterium]
MKKPNLLFFGIDSLRRDHMSLYGYRRLTTPHIDRYLEKDGVVFEQCFSPSIPTTPGYASMLTGMDCFTTSVVALRHEGEIRPGIRTLPEILRAEGYDSSCVGFTGNAGGRGFDVYLDYEGWGAAADGFAHKAENLHKVAAKELDRLAASDRPWFLFLRHMDPHSPYLPPEPFHRMFHQTDPCDPANKSLDPVYEFKPFCDYFRSWFPPGITDKDYVIAQYDAAVAYMDTTIQLLLEKLRAMGLEEDTLVVFTSDHGETLYDHDCYFDHHGLYDPTLVVPFAYRRAGHTSAIRIGDICEHKDIVPTLLAELGIKVPDPFEGRDLSVLRHGGTVEQRPEHYITEATWMRKHGWRTPQWKLIVALEPDFHFKPEVELYDLIRDPGENCNVAEKYPEVTSCLRARMERHIAQREAATGDPNPMYTNLNWAGGGMSPFASSQEAYDSLHIGDAAAARRLQEDDE